MRYHHTKTKGDLGVLLAAADLSRKGWKILWPASEHLEYDVVAERDGAFLRVQVKYRAMREGRIELQFANVWADRHGVHSVPIDKSAIDVVCIYCPDTELCYYLDPKRHRTAVKLRILEPRNGQRRDIVWASDFKELPLNVVRAAIRRRARQDSNLRKLD